MGTGRKFRKTPMTRPKKSPAAKRRRQLEQRRRLIGLGVSEEKVSAMSVKEIRDMLKRPNEVQASS